MPRVQALARERLFDVPETGHFVQWHRSSPAADLRLIGCGSRLGRRLGVARRRCRDDIVNDALGAALAGADHLISGRQVFRNDLQRRVLNTGIGKAFLDRFQHVCAHRRRASRGPKTAAHEKGDRERRWGRATGAAGTARDRPSLRCIRRARNHRSDKGSKAGVHRPLRTRASGAPSSAAGTSFESRQYKADSRQWHSRPSAAVHTVRFPAPATIVGVCFDHGRQSAPTAPSVGTMASRVAPLTLYLSHRPSQ